jgi:hypothetical protein
MFFLCLLQDVIKIRKLRDLMDRIASPTELQAELRSLVAFIQGHGPGGKPDRQVLAAKLHDLADRVGKTHVAATPDWPGADKVYSNLYEWLHQLGAENWKVEVARAKRRRVKPKAPSPTKKMKTIMQALDNGDEEQLKALHLEYKTRGL